MQVTKMKKFVAGCLLVMTSVLLIAESIMGAEQEFKTLELVRTYQSEEEVRATYPDLFPAQTIKDEGDVINFYDPGTKRILKQLRKEQPEVLREEKRGKYTVVWEKHDEYQISNDGTFMLATEFAIGHNKETDGDFGGGRIPKPQKRVLYNAHGQEIVQLPLEVNIIRFSPDKQYFVAYGEDEEPSEYLYLYSIDGALLAKEHMSGYLVAKYTQDGEFFSVFDSFGKKFSIFSQTGKLLYENDYTNLKKHTILYGIFVSDDGTSFLMHTSGTISLFSMKSELLWEVPSSRVIGCRFNSKQHVIQIISVNESVSASERKDIYQLEIRSLNSGKLLDKLEGVIEVRFIKNGGIIILGMEGYYEYSIKE